MYTFRAVTKLLKINMHMISGDIITKIALISMYRFQAVKKFIDSLAER
jgi:NDP-sugar pyrophosphorylase family protein